MDSSSKSTHAMQPRTLTELLPELGGLLQADRFVTQRKRTSPRTEQIMPMTLADMQANLLALESPPSPSPEKPEWNSSIKIDYEKKSRTSEGQMKNNSVRKFQSKTRTPTLRKTMIDTETPKHPTPKPVKMSLDIPRNTTVDIPISPNMSSKSCDASFLQKEKEINDVEEKIFVEKPIMETTELSVLLDIKKETENSINMTKTSIRTLQNVQEAQENTLRYVIKLINEKGAKKISETKNDTTTLADKETEVKIKQKSPMLRVLGIKIKSPSYKILKKN